MLCTLAILACSTPPQTDLIVDWSRRLGTNNSTSNAPVGTLLPLAGGDVIVTTPTSKLERLAPGGATVWSVDIPSPGGFFLFIAGSASDGAGGVLLAGSGFTDPRDFFFRFDGDGNLLWTTEIIPIGTGGFSDLVFHDAVGDGSGGIVAVGNEFVPGVGLRGTIIQVNRDGVEVRREAPYGTSVPEYYAIDRAPSGDYALATGLPFPTPGGLVRRNEAYLFGPDLSPIWRRDLGPAELNRFSRTVGVGGDGGIYVGIGVAATTLAPGMTPGGPNDSPNRARVLRLDRATGSTLWDVEVASSEYVSAVRDFAPATGGGVHVSGFSKRNQGGSAFAAYGLLQRFSPDGTAGPARRFGVDDDDRVQLLGVQTSDQALYAFGLGQSAAFSAPGDSNRSGLVLSLLPEVGGTYCGPAVPNSTGASSRITAHGAADAAGGSLVLRAEALPVNAVALFIVGSEQGSTPILGNGQGIICLGGLLGRYTSGIGLAGPGGVRELVIDLTTTPTPAGPVAVTAGQTWNFQCWYRDANPLPTSNASDAVSVTFN